MSVALAIKLMFDWPRFWFLDSGRPGSSTGPSQSEPSQTQNAPSNMALPVIFFCSNCGEDLEKAIFGRTLQYWRWTNEVLCCCCGQTRQFGQYVGIPNHLSLLLCLFRGRFMKSGLGKLSQHATCSGALKSHLKFYKHSRLMKGCSHLPSLSHVCH